MLRGGAFWIGQIGALAGLFSGGREPLGSIVSRAWPFPVIPVLGSLVAYTLGLLITRTARGRPWPDNVLTGMVLSGISAVLISLICLLAVGCILRYD